MGWDGMGISHLKRRESRRRATHLGWTVALCRLRPASAENSRGRRKLPIRLDLLGGCRGSARDGRTSYSGQMRLPVGLRARSEPGGGRAARTQRACSPSCRHRRSSGAPQPAGVRAGAETARRGESHVGAGTGRRRRRDRNGIARRDAHRTVTRTRLRDRVRLRRVLRSGAAGLCGARVLRPGQGSAALATCWQ